MNFWLIISLLLLLVIAFLAKKLYDFARIIIVFEDNLSEALEIINESESALDNVLEMKFFFDSPEIQQILLAAKETVKFSKIKLNSIAAKFVDLSKKKYVIYTESENIVGNVSDEEQMTEQERISNFAKVPRFTTKRQIPPRLREKDVDDDGGYIE